MNRQRRPKLLIIYTGGTIGMIENPETRSLEPFEFDHLIENVPKIKMLDFDIDSFQFKKPVDSSAMNPRHWCDIAQAIEQNYDAYDGFVVLHGTDTMAYTASALSFMLENLSKPVIITGSQLPIGEVRTDGEENLIAALQIAAATDRNGEPQIREVSILFQNHLWRGNRSIKYSSSNFDAFVSNNYPPLATIGLNISFNKDALSRPEEDKTLHVNYKMDTDILVLDLFPGITEMTVRHLLQTPKIKGIVLRSFGSGNASSEKWFLDALHEADERGIVIVNTTQCYNGSVMPKRYLTGSRLCDCGVVPGHDLTAEAAITKMMMLFGKGLTSPEVKRLMETSIIGEISE